MKYKLTARVTVSCYCDVEADSPEEAKMIASGFTAELGGTNSRFSSENSWIIEEADGEVSNEDVTVEEYT